MESQPLTASAPAARRTALAARLLREMEQAEQQGFGTSTVWLTREETDLICAALARSGAERDTARLDFLDRCAAAMSARDGAERGWQLVIEQDRLLLGATAGLHGGSFGGAFGGALGPGGPHPSCRAAIDERVAELERARNAPATEEQGAARAARGRPP